MTATIDSFICSWLPEVYLLEDDFCIKNKEHVKPKSGKWELLDPCCLLIGGILEVIHVTINIRRSKLKELQENITSQLRDEKNVLSNRAYKLIHVTYPDVVQHQEFTVAYIVAEKQIYAYIRGHDQEQVLMIARHAVMLCPEIPVDNHPVIEIFADIETFK